jgi:hypothetical protein
MMDQQGGPGDDSAGLLADHNGRFQNVQMGMMGCIHTSYGPGMVRWALAALCDLAPYATAGLQDG